MNPASARMLEHMSYTHLPSHLQDISRPLCEVAELLATTLDSDNPTVGAEVTTGLRKLLEAKDCFVRAKVVLSKS